MADKGKLAYVFQKSDANLDQVAQRYGTSVNEIWKATATESGRFRNLSPDEFFVQMRAGDTIYVPYAGDPWEWRVVTLKTRTLKEYCDKKPDPARNGGPPLTPELLWFHLMNASVRDIILQRQPDDVEARRKLDQDPGSVPLHPDDQFIVPYPVRDRAPAVKATRSTDATPAITVETAPEWITALRSIDKQVSSLVAQLEPLDKPCEEVAAEGQTACLHVMALTQLVFFSVQSRPVRNPSDAANLKLLQDSMVKLSADAFGLLFTNPAGKLARVKDGERRTLAIKLKEIYRGNELARLALLAAESPKQRVEGVSVKEIADRIFARCLEAVARSEQAAFAFDDINAAYAALLGPAAGSAPPHQTRDIAAGLTAYVAATNSTVGNLPGPSTLGVALITLQINFAIAKAAKETVEYKQTLIKVKREHELAKDMADWNLATVEEVKAAAAKHAEVAAEATRNRSALFKLADLNDVERATVNSALNNPSNTIELRAAANLISGKTHNTVRWNRVMAGLNFIAFGLSIANALLSDDMFSPANILNCIGAASGLSAGAMKLLGGLSEGGTFYKLFETVAPRFGALGIATAIGTGVLAVTAEGADTTAIVSGVMQAFGASLSLAGALPGLVGMETGLMVMAAPGLQLLGAAIMVVSTAVSAWPVITALLAPGTKKVLLAQLHGVEERPIWKEMATAYPYLKTSFKNVLNALDGSWDCGLFEFERTTENLQTLRTLGFATEDIDRIAPIIVVQPVGWPNVNSGHGTF